MKYLLGVVFMMFVIMGAKADPQWCAGRITQVIVYGNGDVTVFADWRNGWVTICNLSTSYGSVSPQTCKGYLVITQQSIAMGRKSVVYYDSAPACNAIPVYSAAPAPGYVMLSADQ